MTEPTPAGGSAPSGRFEPKKSVPKSFSAKVRSLTRSRNPDKAIGNLAGLLGVTERTVKGWLSGKNASKANTEKILGEIERKRGESAKRVAAREKRERDKDLAARRTTRKAPPRIRLSGDVNLTGKARNGTPGGGRSNSYSRSRHITARLTPEQVDRLYDAVISGDIDEQNAIKREAITAYFNDGGGYDFQPGDIDFNAGDADFY